MTRSSVSNLSYYSFQRMHLCDQFKLVNSLLLFLIAVAHGPGNGENPGHYITLFYDRKLWSLHYYY